MHKLFVNTKIFVNHNLHKLIVKYAINVKKINIANFECS